MKHYAGTVKYTVHKWVEKNMDSIPLAFGTSLSSSKHKVIYSFLLSALFGLFARGVFGSADG